MLEYQAGNPRETEKLLRDLWPILTRFFSSMPDSRTAAEDLAQETLLRIHRVRHTYRPGEPVLPWMYAIARRVRIDHFRKHRRRAEHEGSLGSEVIENRPAPASPPTKDGELEHLLESIPESQREVLTMLKVLGMTIEEVARATSSTVGAVKQKAHRAYEKIRKTLQSERAR